MRAKREEETRGLRIRPMRCAEEKNERSTDFKHLSCSGDRHRIRIDRGCLFRTSPSYCGSGEWAGQERLLRENEIVSRESRVASWTASVGRLTDRAEELEVALRMGNSEFMLSIDRIDSI
jgi:hypothetical protein